MLAAMNLLKVGFALLALLVTGCRSLPEPQFSPPGRSLKVVTYNINYGGRNADRVAEYLRQIDADVVFLQETHERWESFLKQRLRPVYPHMGFHSSGGVAFLSKYKLVHVKVLPAQAGWFPALKAEAVTDLGGVQLLNVHLKPPLTETGSVSVSAYAGAPSVHRRELEGFLKDVDLNRPLIIAGDFNEHEDRGGIGSLRARGFTDALSQFDRSSKTWRWRVNSVIGLANRYDHVLYNSHLYCTGAAVHRVDASDHLPVYAVIINRSSPREHSR